MQAVAKLKDADSSLYGTWTTGTRAALSEAAYDDILSSEALTDRSDVARLSSLVRPACHCRAQP